VFEHTSVRTPEQIAADFWATFDGKPEVEREVEAPYEDDSYLKIYGRPIGGSRRTRPTLRQRTAIRDRQHDRCLYCGFPIGTLVFKRGVQMELRAAYDHFIPHAYAHSNRSDNWVLACHVCNGIKWAKVFNTVNEAQLYIRERRRERRYVFPDDMSQT
jgi:hypothetical protein